MKPPRVASTGHFVEHFTNQQVDNLRITKIQALIQPQLLLEEVPATESGQDTVRVARQDMRDILEGFDDRVAVIVGPCSIHDPEAAMEYARLLLAEARRLHEELLVVMRVYFEKPRTTVGWKGLIYDPDLDDSCKINVGLRSARKLLVDINHMGLPCAAEFLDTIVPQYIADQIAWGAIGARTVESQLHRQLAAGLSMPVGFKNGTSGDLQVAVDACRAANHERQTFLGITKQGLPAVVHTKGNGHAHLILRGGKTGPNYSPEHIAAAAAAMAQVGQTPRLVVDVSHGNSEKDFTRQPKVLADLCRALAEGPLGPAARNLAGVMIESNLGGGNQPLPSRAQAAAQGHASVLAALKRGVSVTDGCVDWPTTVEMLDSLAAAVRVRRERVRAEGLHAERQVEAGAGLEDAAAQ